MYATSPTRHVKRRGRTYRCYWCWQRIAVGERYAKWLAFDGGERHTVYMHDECCEAASRADLDEELPTPGTYRRGCYCWESKEDCCCETRE
jgi:hypothetical protein